VDVVIAAVDPRRRAPRLRAAGAIALALLPALLAAGCADVTEPGDDRAAPRPGVVRAAGGTPLAEIPGLERLAAHLRRRDAARLRHRDVRTAIRPALQAALVGELRAAPGAGVLLDVRDGRLLAATGSHGRDPWRTRQAPGATLYPILAAGALSGGKVTATTRLDGNGDDGPGDVRNAGGTRLGPITIGAALAHASRTAFADVAVRLSAWTVDELLRRVGFDARARAGDLSGLVARSRGAGLTPTGAHGVGPVPGFVDARGAYQDAGDRARATTLELAQLALTLASDGRRTDAGVTRAGPRPVQERWEPAVGRWVRGMLAAAVREGAVPGMRGSGVRVAGIAGRVGGTTTVLAFAPTGRPRVALALTGDEDAATLGARARRLLERATDADSDRHR